MLGTLRQSWWAYLLQGILTTLFGVVAVAWPGMTVFTLLLMFAVYAVLVGLFRVVSALRNRVESGRWWALLSGLGSIVAGIVAFAWPGLTGLLLLFIIGAHALFSGVVSILQTIRHWRTTRAWRRRMPASRC